MWKILFTTGAEKDKKLLKQAGLDKNAKKILNVISINPFQTPPRYEKLIGSLDGFYSRRINIKHRLVYKVYDDEHTIVVYTMWTHYENN